MRLEAGQLAMAHHAAGEEPHREQRHQDPDGQVARGIGAVGEGHTAQSHGQNLQIGIAAVPAAALEAQDEAQQVNAERQHPQERDGGHVLRQVIGDGQQQHRGAGRQGQPQGVQAQARLLRRRPFRRGLHHVGVPRAKGGEPAQRDEHAVGDGPDPGLLMGGEDRFEQKRITDEREHGAGIRERVQAIRHRALEAARVPRLQQRPGGGEQEIGEADGHRQQPQNPESGVFARGGFPGDARINGQHRRADQQQAAVEQHLDARFEVPDHGMGVEVPEQKRHLEEEQTGGPNRRRAAEPGQDDLGDHRLNLE